MHDVFTLREEASKSEPLVQQFRSLEAYQGHLLSEGSGPQKIMLRGCFECAGGKTGLVKLSLFTLNVKSLSSDFE